MSSHKEKLVFNELKELKNLETELHTKLKGLTHAGKEVPSWFVSSLCALEIRAQQLDRMLDL